ncbi:ABC transporter permease [Candidatus Poribacteria bacterium]|nr:ABC transporter permease [Candidatus Poribacteria bacterium]
MKIPIIYNWRSILARPLTTILTVLGIALVVFVFAAVLMLANGLKKTLVGTGEETNAIVLRKGADSEISSIVTRDQYNILKTLPEVAVTADGTPLVAGELVVVNNIPRRADDGLSNVMVRGVSKESLLMRSKVRLVKGTMWRPGLSEIIAGSSVSRRFQGCGMGESVKMGGREWVVVGIFEADGTGFESELWGDVEQFMDAFERPIFSSVTMHMKDPSRFEEMKTRIENDPRLTVSFQREREFYEKQSQSLGLFIRVLGLTITIIFSFAAMTGAVITMYSAVANRSAEIGTLRALGFRRRSILASFLVECILISLLGGMLGLALASLLQFISISTTNFQSFAELAFGFSLSSRIAVNSLLFAVIMGIIGGMAPAVRASRMRVATALRAA